MEDERVVGGIPFPDDLLFHFWNKNTVITDTYIYDIISGLKLYAKQSFCVKPTALSTGIKLPNAEIDEIGKVEACVHHKLADVENFGYVWASQNTAGPSYATTGLYLTTNKIAYNSYFKGSTSGGCTILTSALEDDNTYIFTTDFMTDNVVMKANKVTIIDNEIIVGSDINGSTTAKGTETLTADIGILSGRTNSAYVYSSKHKVIWVKFYDKSGVLMHEFNFSEGAGEVTYDTVTGSAYPISNINIDPAAFWNYRQDINHYNFKNGFTLYQKSGSPDIRIPNKKDGSEIILPAPPTGYTRIENYKECRLTFNNSENTFKLDDTQAASTDLTLSGWGDSFFNGDVFVYDVYEGKNRYINNTIGTYTRFIVWQSGQWKMGNSVGGVYWYSAEDVLTPDLVTTWITSGGALPIGTITAQAASALKTADIDDVLFDDLGVAKEIDLKLLNMASISDRGYLYYNETLRQNFMLYATNKTLESDVKIIKYIGMSSRITYTESGAVEYDENNHAKITEV